ncbi:divalent-cation tolerance protein CutA [Halorientalis brevis]|uniref:Divalent-cation tolerance protein CutA n=1 Tax=Halorientalis brevis TaxID=1126241 RepID=A0ABD6CE95_9EURY|nr:divalent-cation tolerance protein CutA [Halorientalis brevis]
MPTAYVTAPPEAAEDIARTLVEEELAACVNRLPCQSIYRWDGEVHDDDEAVMFVKTTAAGYEALEARLTELHPYEVPCIERFDEDQVLDAFADWRADAVEE